MSEFAPPGSGARMTKSQVKKYVKDLKKAQALAQAKLDAARASGELNQEEQELAAIEEKMNNIDNIA